MSKINKECHKTALAIALASGRTVKDWARENGVVERTVYHWSKDREVRDQVEEIRERIIDGAVGLLCEHATAAIREIVRLLKDGKSESVRLHAARAVLAELMAVSSYAALKGRMAELERVVREGSRSAVPGTAPGPDPSVEPDGPPADGPSGEEGLPCPA